MYTRIHIVCSAGTEQAPTDQELMGHTRDATNALTESGRISHLILRLRHESQARCWYKKQKSAFGVVPAKHTQYRFCSLLDISYGRLRKLLWGFDNVASGSPNLIVRAFVASLTTRPVEPTLPLLTGGRGRR